MSLCLIAHQKAMGQKTVGRYPYALVHVQSFSAEPWVMLKKKSRCSMPGPAPLMTYPSPNRATKYLCVRLTRPACSRWHASAWLERGTTGVPRDGPNHSGAAEPTSSGRPDRWFRLGKIYGSSQFRPTALARACSMRTYKGSSFEGTCLRNSLSAFTVAKAWISCPSGLRR